MGVCAILLDYGSERAARPQRSASCVRASAAVAPFERERGLYLSAAVQDEAWINEMILQIACSSVGESSLDVHVGSFHCTNKPYQWTLLEVGSR
jgi:hypothetical protein